MKVLLLCLLAFGELFASSYKLEGVIAGVDNANKTITIDSIYGDSVLVKVLPNTEIDLSDCGVLGLGRYGTFKDLSVGAFVEIKLYFHDANERNPTAFEIEIECYKKKAY